MQKSGFFNAILSGGVYDRTYNANDYTDNLAVVISNGVLRGVDDDLKVTASGMVVTVGVGRAWINGHYYVNDTPYSFAAVSAPTGGTRYDRVFLRLNNNLAARSITLVYQQGTAGNNPAKPEPVREGNIYDIVLADIFVGTNATSVTVADTRANADLCGWVYSTSGDNSFFTSLDAAFVDWFEQKKETLSSVTLFKRYNWRTAITSATKTVTFDIPQYDAATCFIEVYVNGILVTDGVDYTVAASVLTFNGSLIVGTEVEVKCYKSIDGTGIMSVADEITELQNKVDALQKDTAQNYICNGINDNVGISEMAQAFLNGTGNFATADADAQLTIKVYGTFGATAAYAGNGTSESPFRWILLGNVITSSAKRVVVDFAGCDKVYINLPTDTTNEIFAGKDCHIKNANVLVDGGASVTMFGGAGDISAHNCSLTANVTGFAVVSYAGTFRDCNTLMLAGGNAINFYGANGKNAIFIEGGKHRAYTKNSTGISAVIYSGVGDTSAAVVVSAANFPTEAFTGYKQNHAINFGAGYISGYGNLTTLPVNIGTAAVSSLGAAIPLNRL